jgi:outer membrane protein assembly factor BamA
MALPLQPGWVVRAIVFVTAVVIVAAWLMFRHGPLTTANAEAAVNRPVARFQQVRSVSLDGRQLLSSRLRAMLQTHPGEQLDAERLRRDRDAMESALADLGYLAARVAPAVVTFDTAGAAYVTFEVDQGALFHLRNVEVTGPGKGAIVVTLTTGDTAIRDRIEQARRSLAEGLARRGRP